MNQGLFISCSSVMKNVLFLNISFHITKSVKCVKKHSTSLKPRFYCCGVYLKIRSMFEATKLA